MELSSDIFVMSFSQTHRPALLLTHNRCTTGGFGVRDKSLLTVSFVSNPQRTYHRLAALPQSLLELYSDIFIAEAARFAPNFLPREHKHKNVIRTWHEDGYGLARRCSGHGIRAWQTHHQPLKPRYGTETC